VEGESVEGESVEGEGVEGERERKGGGEEERRKGLQAILFATSVRYSPHTERYISQTDDNNSNSSNSNNRAAR
jgi:hypothetical protein